MPALEVDDTFIEEEPGLFNAAGTALAFFYYRTCDRASDMFLDAVGLGAEDRRLHDRSTYSATATLQVEEPVRRGQRLTYRVSVRRIGGKSITYRVEVLGAEDGRRRAVFDTVGVCMDMTGPKPMQIPDEIRARIEEFVG
jgi:acyl-CoA thioesterase FadM